MKKLALIFLLSSFSLISIAQKTKRVKSGSKHDYEIYHVVKGMKNTKHGKYEQYNSKKLTVSGSYDMGARVGIWKYYNYKRLTKTEQYLENGVAVTELYSGFNRTTTYLSQEQKVKNGPFLEELAGQPYTVGRYVENEKEGKWEFYFNGKIFFETTYNKGVLSEDKAYSGDTLISHIIYKNGMLDGKVVRNYGNGKPERIAYYKMGKLDGNKTYFNRKGDVVSKTDYKAGEKDGKSVSYYKKGKMRFEHNYSMGKLDGVQKNYYENGQLMFELKMEMGKPVILLKNLNSAGVLNESAALENGTGSINIYKELDTLMYELHFKDGLLHGSQKYFHTNGELKSSEDYTNGALNGLCINYDENGKIIKKGYVQDSIMFGEWILYNAKEATTEKKMYELEDEEKYSPQTNLSYALERTYPVYKGVEEMPEYPGGMSGLGNLLRSEVTYPEMERNNDVQGVSYVNFVVDQRGFITDVKIYPGTESMATNNMHNEAMRVIKMMPRWKPGFQLGRPVNVSYTIPVRFKLR